MCVYYVSVLTGIFPFALYNDIFLLPSSVFFLPSSSFYYTFMDRLSFFFLLLRHIMDRLLLSHTQSSLPRATTPCGTGNQTRTVKEKRITYPSVCSVTVCCVC